VTGAPPAEDHDRKWAEFSRTLVAVLAGTVVAVMAATVAVTTLNMGSMVRGEQARNAQVSAQFLARRAFVPVILEDAATLARVVDIYLEDPDVTSIQVTDAGGKVLLSRDRRGPPPHRFLVAEQDVRPPAESGGPKVTRPVGRVRIVFSLDRVYGALERFIIWVAGLASVLLIAAVAVDVALISRMTRRLKDLVGEARLAEDLRRSNKELEQFAFVASHDLQEPIRKIVSFSQLLERRYRGKLDQQAEEYIDHIVSGGTRMRALVQDLLAFSRVGTQGRPLQPTDAGAVVREVLTLFEDTIASSGASVTVEPLPVVLADVTQLPQLFQNLIGNALKFRSDEPPRVRVVAERQGRWWRFSVEDNGLGISEHDREKVFEMFKRLHSREKYPGTGIGLAICKKIVERHGGRIWIAAAPKRGTVFRFTLPAVPAAQGDA